MRVMIVTVLWATALLTVACGVGPAPQPPAPAEEPAPEEAPQVETRAVDVLIGPVFVAATIEGRPVTEGVESSIRFEAEGRVVGNAGCNNLQGTYEVDGASMSFGPLAVTRKMCPPAMMDQEAVFLQALARVRSFEWTDDGALVLVPEEGDSSRFIPSPTEVEGAE